MGYHSNAAISRYPVQSFRYFALLESRLVAHGCGSSLIIVLQAAFEVLGAKIHGFFRHHASANRFGRRGVFILEIAVATMHNRALLAVTMIFVALGLRLGICRSYEKFVAKKSSTLFAAFRMSAQATHPRAILTTPFDLEALAGADPRLLGIAALLAISTTSSSLSKADETSRVRLLRGCEALNPPCTLLGIRNLGAGGGGMRAS